MLKKFLIGTFVAVALMAASVATAAYDFGPTTLKVGSKGVYVSTLQTLVGATADGVFGPMTKAKVQAWQAANGLTPDGLFGNLSKAVANSSSTTTTTTTTTTTSVAGCAPGALFSSTTGASCTVVATTGCPAGALFNSMTGAACTGTTVVTSGMEGSLAATYAPTPISNLAVNRGETKNVAGIELKATGSNMNVNRVWLNLTAGSISPRIWLAASEMALLDGGTVISTVPLSASTVVEVTAGSEYQVQFNGLNINVPVNTTKVLTVRITRPELTSANGTINLGANAISVRATDGAGFSEAVTISATRVLNLANATAAVGTLTATLSSSSPKEQSVSGISTTSGVLTPVKLLDFDLKATDGAINVSKIAGIVTPSGCTSVECVASVELRDGATVLSSVVGADAISFNNLSIDIAANTTKTLSVWGQVNPISGTLLAGESVLVTINDVDATSGPSFTDKSITPSVVGYAQHFFENAPVITIGTRSASNTGADNKNGAYSIAFTVTAPSGSDIYVGETVGAAAKIKTAKTNATASVGGALASSISVSNATAVGGDLGYKILAGQTATFTVTGYIPFGGGDAGFNGMKITEIDWNTTNSVATDIDQTWSLEDFKTAEVYIAA